MSLQVFFGDTVVDIETDDFTINIQNNTLDDLASRQVSYSQSFSLQKTTNNIELLQNIGLLGATSTEYNKNIKCRIEYDGIEISAELRPELCRYHVSD